MINSTYDEEAVLDNTTADATATVDTTTATVEAEPTSRLPRWLRAPQPKPLRPQKEVDKLYPRLRFQVFIGIFIGYASFYLIRNNVSLVANTLSENGLSKTDIGIIANCLLLAYGFSKFFAATISDRANARFFMPLGLILSGLTNILIGISADGTISVSIFAVLMTINGIFQGMGWPPAGRVMVHWFSTSERGGKMALWNIAHNVGGALSGALVAYALDHFGSDNWASAFWFPAVICFILAIITFFLVRDNPQSMGLPSIEEYHNDPAPVEIDEADKTESTWQTIRRHILRNPPLWCTSLSQTSSSTPCAMASSPGHPSTWHRSVAAQLAKVLLVSPSLKSPALSAPSSAAGSPTVYSKAVAPSPALSSWWVSFSRSCSTGCLQMMPPCGFPGQH